MPQRQPVRLQLGFESRAERAGGNPCGTGDLVDLQHPVEVAQIHADRPGVAVADVGLDPAGHARAAPERNGRDAGIAAPFEDSRHLALVARKRDKIGSVRVVTAKRAHEISEGLAVGVTRPLVRIVAESRLERCRR
jgi:hypothetical protein